MRAESDMKASIKAQDLPTGYEIHPEKIDLFIRTPTNQVIKIRVSPTQQVESVSNIFSVKKTILFHRGSILNTEISFLENGVISEISL
jgi:hypothetical protein